MMIPCTSFKAISSATQIRSKIELYLKKINGGSIPVGPLGPQIESAYSRGLIAEDVKDNLENILVNCEKILFNDREGEFIEFKEVLSWAAYVDSIS